MFSLVLYFFMEQFTPVCLLDKFYLGDGYIFYPTLLPILKLAVDIQLHK